MADNVAITAGSGTTIASDDIGGVQYQRVKPTWGADGTANDVNATTPLPVQFSPVTSGGCDVGKLVSAASTNATSLKASAGQVYGVVIVNTNASARYFKFYNKASAPTVGTDTPLFTLGLPGSGGVSFSFPHGIPFGTGIAYATTTEATDAGSTGVAANEITALILYK